RIRDGGVPPELRVKRPSGVKAFDQGLGGEGMTPSMVTLFTGEAGAGKTTLLMEVAAAYSERGYNVVFNTAEESAYQLRMTYDRLQLKGAPLIGQISRCPDLLEQCDYIRERDPTKPFILIQDSLQVLDDGKFKNGRVTCATAERSLEQITNWTKARMPGVPDEVAFANSIVIGQVNKSGKMAGSAKLMHMIDARMHMSVEKDEKSEWFDCRKIFTPKNRFGGAGMLSFMRMGNRGLTLVGQVSSDLTG
ncbi:MAG: hypothetical protein HOE14_05535, partial [Gemmatimonadales bacterium]|nr:hypothetical protein [Gemmatimonadales bacterium]